MSKPLMSLPGQNARHHRFLQPIRLNQVAAIQTLLLDLTDFLTAKNRIELLLNAGELLHYWLATPVGELWVNTDHEEFRQVCELINTLARAAATNRVFVVGLNGKVEVWGDRNHD